MAVGYRMWDTGGAVVVAIRGGVAAGAAADVSRMGGAGIWGPVVGGGLRIARRMNSTGGNVRADYSVCTLFVTTAATASSQPMVMFFLFLVLFLLAEMGPTFMNAQAACPVGSCTARCPVTVVNRRNTFVG